MTHIADVVVYSPDRKIQLVVEVKNRKNVTDEWASKFRRNLVAHSAIPRAKFFLLVLPNYSYLWRDSSSADSVGADYKLTTEDILRPYLEGLQLEDLSEKGFELLVEAWLGDLLNSQFTKQSVDQKLHWLFDSGLYEEIKHGHIATEVFV